MHLPTLSPRRVQRRAVAAVLVTSTALSACSTDAVSGPSAAARTRLDGPPAAPREVTVTVTPSTVLLEPGQQTQLTATVTNWRGELQPDRRVLWSSDNPATVSVDESGLVTALTAGGPVTITASTVNGQSAHGRSASGNASVTVQPPEGPSLLYADDFSSGLQNWITKGGGSWITVDGELIGDYGIGCGSSGCPQSQLLLTDLLQPGDIDWRMEIQSGLVEAYCCYNGGEMSQRAKFVLWISDSEKETFDIGYGWVGTPAPPSASIVYVSHQAYPWHNVGYVTQTVPTWIPSEWQNAVLEKRGNTYTVYFNGVQLYSATRTFSGVPRVGFNTYGKVRMDNFRLLALP